MSAARADLAAAVEAAAVAQAALDAALAAAQRAAAGHYPPVPDLLLPTGAPAGAPMGVAEIRAAQKVNAAVMLRTQAAALARKQLALRETWRRGCRAADERHGLPEAQVAREGLSRLRRRLLDLLASTESGHG